MTTPSKSSPLAFLTAATGLAALALLLRLYKIGVQEFWLDEGYSYLLATAPDWFGPATMANNTPPLYHFLLRGWMAVAGQDEAGLRLLSAVFGTLFVIVVIWTGREIFTPAVGLWSGGFAAIAPTHVFLSQDARTYALLVFALTLTYVLLWRALHRNTGGAWALAVLAAALALYSHYLSVLGLLPTALLPWTLPPDRRTGQRWRRFLLAMSGALLLFGPWGLATFLLESHPLDPASSPWIEASWKQIPPALAIPKSLEILGLGGQAGLATTFVKQFAILEFSPGLRLLGVGALVALALWVAVPWGDRHLGVVELWRRKVWLATLLLFPLIALWVVSYWIRPIYILGRYDTVAFPAYTLMVGLGFAKLQRVSARGPLLAFVAALVLCIPLVTKLVRYYEAPAVPEARSTARFLDTFLADDDILLFTSPRGHLLLYYLSRIGYRWDSGRCRSQTTGRRFDCRFFPLDNERTLLGITGRDVSLWQAARQDLHAALARLPPAGGTVWLVVQWSSVTPQGLALLEFDGLVVDELTRLRFTVDLERARDDIYPFRRSP